MQLRKRSRGLAAAGAMGLAAGTLLVQPAAHAAPWTFVPCGDTTALNAAIIAGNQTGRAVIKLAPRCTYQLTSPFAGPTGLTPVTGDITIDAGPRDPRFRGTGRRDEVSSIVRRSATPFRILQVMAGGRLTLRHIAIRNGSTSGYGGGIDNNGQLTLNASEVSGSTAGQYGGGIGSEASPAAAGSVTLIDSKVFKNTASGGAGLAVLGTLWLQRSTVYGNGGAVLGGGILALGPVSADGSTLANNSAASLGGGIFAATSTSTLLIRRSHVVGNAAGDYGGGIFFRPNTPITAQVDDSSFYNNTAQGGGAIMAPITGSALIVNRSRFAWNKATGSTGGGAVYNSASLTMTGSVLHSNTAVQGPGGGLANVNGTAVLTSSKVVNNAAAQGGGISNAGGTVQLQRTRVFHNRPDNCFPVGGIPNCAG